MTSNPESVVLHELARETIRRKHSDAIGIQSVLSSGVDTDGCLVCCSAPACCPMLGVLPCFGNPEYIVKKHESSKYVYIRENSLEWNTPIITLDEGVCCGIDPCMYTVRDRVHVLYFDDPVFNHITDQTRSFNELRTCLCGGRGERIQMDSRCCWHMFYRTHVPCICVPICCPSVFCPCAQRREIFVKDAQHGIYEISKALKYHQTRSSQMEDRDL
mmetsp:Transcript_10616/g.16090  ORF Transcript_10616/g.16090 Transcript_10616/m.16090 type:complete len:216 (-) Transcript_10616:145-792(-)